MSARQSLYGQSLVRNAATITVGSDQQEKHWKRDWFVPAKAEASTPAVLSSAGTPTPFGDERDTPEVTNKLGFSVKAWLPTSDFTPTADGDDNDFIDFTQFSSSEQAATEAKKALTDAAIRGAVGGESVLPGLSASTDAATSSETPVETPVETPASETPVVETVTKTETPTPAPIPVSAEAIATEEPVTKEEPTDTVMEDATPSV